jgi:hypothetical protein
MADVVCVNCLKLVSRQEHTTSTSCLTRFRLRREAFFHGFHPGATPSTMTSRLTDSLRKLQSVQSLVQRQVHERAVAELDDFQKWQSRWSDRRDEIAKQLTLIDEHLDQFIRHNPRRPRLSLVVAPVGS